MSTPSSNLPNSPESNSESNSESNTFDPRVSPANPSDLTSVEDASKLGATSTQASSIGDSVGDSVGDAEAPPTATSSKPVPQKLGLRPKVILSAIALATVPVIIAGVIGTVWVDRQLRQAEQSSPTSRAPQSLQWQFPLWFGLTTLVSGSIAAILAHRGIRPVVKAALKSNQMVNRVEREGLSLRDRAAGQDEMVALAINLNLLEAQIPKLMGEQEGELERSRVLLRITQRMREALSEEEVFRIAAIEIRQAFRADRVAMYRLDSAIDGTIIEESVGAGWPKMLWTTLEDPCLADYLDWYREGRIRAIHDLYNSGLDDCHIGLLERFGIKANLVAPIIKDNELFGLMIVNQCTNPREWQTTEIELLSQITNQLGYALDIARLMERSSDQVDHNQLLVDLLQKVRASLNEENVLQSVVTEWRKALRTDRILVYGLDDECYGTVLAESVVPGVPKAIHANIHDPCFEQGYVGKYQQGRVQAVTDIYNANLTRCHLEQLEPFQVKANLVAPILKDQKLYGLLIAHECSGPRQWQKWEIELHRQLAIQVGYALEQARLLQKTDSEMNQMQQLLSFSAAIAQSVEASDVMKVTVDQVRKIFQTDRVIIYRFDENWYGTVVAESVIPGVPKTLWAEIKDPCFAQGFVSQYQAGRVQAVNDIRRAGLTECHLQQLETYGVKANLVAPILNKDRLVGLLIAHECATPRAWQPEEITLIQQMSLQVGLALDHAQLLAQIEQAYQSEKMTSQSQRQSHQSLQQQVTQVLREGEETATGLQANAIKQLDAVTAVYHRLKTNETSDQQTQALMQQAQLRQQQMDILLAELTGQFAQVATLIQAIHETHRALLEKTQDRSQLGDLSTSHFDTVTDIVTQLKLQAMNVALEAARMGEAGKDFASIGETVLELARHLDLEWVNLKPFLLTLQSDTRALLGEVSDNTQYLAKGLEQTQRIEEHCDRLLQDNQSLAEGIQSLATTLAQQAQEGGITQQGFMELAGHVRQTSEQSIAIVKTIERWHTILDQPVDH